VLENSFLLLCVLFVYKTKAFMDVFLKINNNTEKDIFVKDACL